MFLWRSILALGSGEKTLASFPWTGKCRKRLFTKRPGDDWEHERTDFIGQHAIHDHILSIGGLSKLVVSRELLAAPRRGRQWHVAYLEEQKQEKQKEAQSKKWKAVFEDKTDLQKKKRLSTEISALLFDAEKLGKEAEGQASSSHQVQCNEKMLGRQEKRFRKSRRWAQTAVKEEC